MITKEKIANTLVTVINTIFILGLLGNYLSSSPYYTERPNAEAATVSQPPIPNIDKQWECVLYEGKVCYVWRHIPTNTFYDSQGNRVPNPFP